MISMVSRLWHTWRILVVVGFLLLLPFVANMQLATAAPMRHMGGDMHESCATACAQLTTNALPQAVLDQSEVRTPDPTPRMLEPYFVQFLLAYEPKALRPAHVVGSYAIRPPDIVALTTNYRL